MNLLRVFVLCLICISVACPVNSQVPVTVSKKKTVVDGKSYYLHTVKQGETLYSISKAYNVLQKDIVFNNPDAFEGIRVGQELKIPAKPDNAATTGQLESAQFIYHITEKGQTVYSLTQQYNVSLEDLYKYNPELEHSPLQSGQVVTIPKSGKSVEVQPKPSVGYIVHVVKRKETLFSIAKSYDVDLNRVLEINPDIDANEPKIKIGQEIKIPLAGAVPISLPVAVSKTDTVIVRRDLEPVSQPVVVPTTQIPSSGVAVEDTGTCEPIAQKEFRVAMLLPFFLADNAPASPPDSALVKDAEGRFRYKDGRYWIHPRSVNTLEFYEGALLAVDSLKKQGLEAKIYVFDTMRDTIKLAQILKSPVMKDMDLIIGPFYTELVDQTARFARENKIYYVSPTAVNANSLKANPYLMQINAGEINAVGPMVDFIATRENVHVTLIGNKSEWDQTLFNAYRNKLKTVFADSSLTVHQFRTDSLKKPASFLKKKRLNVVIIPATDEAFVNVMTAQLNASVHSHQINLFGLASWTKFVNLDAEYFHALEFRYATAFQIDYQKSDVRRFLQQYRMFYGTEPTMLTGRGSLSPSAYQFAFLGYDAVFYFASAMQQYGKGFGRCIPKFHQPGIQSDFRFVKIDPLSGYLNTHFDIYRYTRDYTVVKENIAESGGK